MADESVERRLAAIVAIDVAGYSRLMGADEEGTLATLKAHRVVTDPIGTRHGGRIVGTAGDGLLVEFPSVVEAVNYAIEIQAAMSARNADIPDDQKMLFRIGINLGDVLADGETIYGDGVNIAARIEALAEPGGICLSRTVRDNVRDRINIALEDMGEVEVKNIARPVRVFRVLPDGIGVDVPTTHVTKLRPYVAVAAVAVALLVAVAGAWWWLQPDLRPADPSTLADNSPAKPSVAVLPFANLSDDKGQEYFADGMTDGLITDLSKVSGLEVVARNSAFAYKDKNVKVQDVAKDLDVSHVLEGSVQRAGDQIRMNAQLIDGKTGKHLWAETFDREFKDVFKLQDELSEKIVAALKVALTPDEQQALAKLPTEDVEAYEHYLQAEALRLTFHWNSYGLALAYYREALQRDPAFVAARLGNARALFLIWRNGWTTAMPDPSEALGLVQEELSEIARLAPGDPGAASLNIGLSRYLGDSDTALKLAQSAVARHPNKPRLYSALSSVLSGLGKNEAALKAAEKALLLSPRPDPELWLQLGSRFAYLRKFGRAKDLLQRARKAGADVYETAFPMISAHVGLAEIEPAKKELTNVTSRWDSANLTLIRTMFQHNRDPEFEVRAIAPLAKAGMPEWPYGRSFDESKRVGAEELAALFKPPFTIEGADFTFTELKGGSLCVHRPWRVMGRSYCAPVYRDPEFIKSNFLSQDLIVLSIHSGVYGGFDVFSVKHDD
jgi:adenylate cyclase